MTIFSGQLITWGEFFTMGSDPVRLDDDHLAGAAGEDSPGVQIRPGLHVRLCDGRAAGLIQANVGLNMVFHNTQWVVALHAHTFLLTGVGSMLFCVIYTLVPMMTGVEFKNRLLVNRHLWLWLIGSVGMSYAMGMAGSKACCAEPYTPRENSPLYTGRHHRRYCPRHRVHDLPVQPGPDPGNKKCPFDSSPIQGRYEDKRLTIIA